MFGGGQGEEHGEFCDWYEERSLGGDVGVGAGAVGRSGGYTSLPQPGCRVCIQRVSMDKGPDCQVCPQLVSLKRRRRATTRCQPRKRQDDKQSCQ